ncbi:hypothetical protein ACTHTU_01260 [Neisseria sp. P0020.S005]|uniref:hypothetical protein n=1 Tax=Neisseria sp. P0020.S005 TaxID=3436810 RepID=UPI003F7FA798
MHTMSRMVAVSSVTVYVYSSETPLKQADINLLAPSGRIRITAEVETDANADIICESLRITDLASSELVKEDGEIMPLPSLDNRLYNEAVYAAASSVYGIGVGLVQLPIQYE